MENKTAILLFGPTAIGKTAVAIDVAQAVGTEIISADSRQCFREMKIGVARPSEEELQKVPHHFIASHSVTDDVTASSFEKFALQKTAVIFKDHDQVVIAGGTGLYLKAFAEGLDDIPPVPKTIRDELISKYETNGLAWLQEEIAVQDPLFAAQGETHNPQRMLRALEVTIATGKSILEYRKQSKANRNFKIRKIGLTMNREKLYDRINRRVDQMIDNGLLYEVEQLQPYRHLNALQTVGYAELFQYLDGDISLERAIELIKQNTRRYAKRQLTWFLREKDVEWFEPSAIEQIIAVAKK